MAVWGIAFYRGMYFGMFDTFKSKVKKDGKSNFIGLWMLGMSGTCISSSFIYPFDTMRR